jgi:hypothetical protein
VKTGAKIARNYKSTRQIEEGQRIQEESYGIAQPLHK